MNRQEDWALSGADNHPILGTTHHPDPRVPPRGVLLIAHGFKGYKDYGFIPHLAEAAAEAGFIAHRFNFSHSGMTNRLEAFERKDLFERETWGKQVFDLHAVSHAARSGDLAGGGLPQAWFGHSRGGVAVILAAGSAREESTALSPAAVITAAAPHTAERLNEDDKAALRERGRIESPSSRTGEMLYVGRDWLDEMDADPARYDALVHASRLLIPMLILHGDDDATVPVMSARLLHKAAGSRASLVVIEGASHTFNSPNPLPLDATPPPATTQLIIAAMRFACTHIHP